MGFVSSCFICHKNTDSKIRKGTYFHHSKQKLCAETMKLNQSIADQSTSFLANEPFLGKIGRISLYLQVKSLDFAVKSLYLPVKSLYLPCSKIPMFSSKIPIFTGKIPMFSSKIPIFTSKIHSFYCFHLRFSLFSLAENRKLPGSVALWCQMMRTPSRMERICSPKKLG